jgi:haloalkane dehalogenase
MFKALRTPGIGEVMVLEGNFFVEEILPKFGVMRELTKTEMAAYRPPFPTPKSRLPTLQWPHELPIGGTPESSGNEIDKNSDWLLTSDLPKLLFYAEPGALIPEQVVDYMAANLTNLETRFLGAGLHFVQEDHPHLIGQGLIDWLRRI